MAFAGAPVERGRCGRCNRATLSRILCAMRRTALLEAGVALAAALSVGMMGVMLAAPWLPRPAEAPLPLATAPAVRASPNAALPPIGLYQMRTAFSSGSCLAIELRPESYPVAEATEGTATVLWWTRGMTGCDTRTSEVERVTARTHVVSDPADPGAEPVGYTLQFALPLVDGGGRAEGGETVRASVTILARRSTDAVLQAVEDAPGSGQGYVLDRVPAVDPPHDPLPSAPPGPGAGVGPMGLYLLRGPFQSDDPCLAVDLTQASYPRGSQTEGTATVLWWERGGADLDDATVCMTRRGEMHQAPATVTLVTDSSGAPLNYAMRFALPLAGGDVVEEVEIGIMLESRTPDQLQAVMVRPAGTDVLVFDRVDQLDPPLVPAPSPPAAP